jgi:hypothetical protein
VFFQWRAYLWKRSIVNVGRVMVGSILANDALAQSSTSRRALLLQRRVSRAKARSHQQLRTPPSIRAHRHERLRCPRTHCRRRRCSKTPCQAPSNYSGRLPATMNRSRSYRQSEDEKRSVAWEHPISPSQSGHTPSCHTRSLRHSSLCG